MGFLQELIISVTGLGLPCTHNGAPARTIVSLKSGAGKPWERRTRVGQLIHFRQASRMWQRCRVEDHSPRLVSSATNSQCSGDEAVKTHRSRPVKDAQIEGCSLHPWPEAPFSRVDEAAEPHTPRRQHASTPCLQLCIVPHRARLPWHLQTKSHWANISQPIPTLPFFDKNSAFVTPLPS